MAEVNYEYKYELITESIYETTKKIIERMQAEAELFAPDIEVIKTYLDILEARFQNEEIR